jgi:hypothetical protein
MLGRRSKRGYLRDSDSSRGDLRRDRRRPAFFLEALLSEDIPPYLTNQRGEKLDLTLDPIASDYQANLNTDPASL